MLPSFMGLACQLHVPVHRSNHSAGKAQGIPYPEKVGLEMEEIANEIRAGKFCDNPNALIEKFNNLSKIILGKIDKFRWTITADGKDYKQNGNGCAGVTSISNKPNQPCSCARTHGLTRKDETNIIPRNAQPLEIGK
ncbi:MAG: hypothetical protein GY820_00670 [Gammaproteobacteria bacterium]|nr:hypothetical protein [Gammaproteobacteria bacterium]